MKYNSFLQLQGILLRLVAQCDYGLGTLRDKFVEHRNGFDVGNDYNDNENCLCMEGVWA